MSSKTHFEFWRDIMRAEAVKTKDGFILELYFHMDYLYKYVGEDDYFLGTLAGIDYGEGARRKFQEHVRMSLRAELVCPGKQHRFRVRIVDLIKKIEDSQYASKNRRVRHLLYYLVEGNKNHRFAFGESFDD